jgi:hypothetical protein
VVTMQNQNMPAFPSSELTLDPSDLEGDYIAHNRGFTKWEWITLEMYKIVLKRALAENGVNCVIGRSEATPNAVILWGLAEKMAKGVIAGWDQHHAGLAAEHPLNQRSRPPKRHPLEMEFEDD